MAPRKPRPPKVFAFNPQTDAQIARNPITMSAADSTAPTPFAATPTATQTATQTATPAATPAAEQPTFDPFSYQRDQDAIARRNRQMNSVAAMRGLMTSYGLESLMTLIEGYVAADYTDDTIASLIRTTPQYATRFPAMAALAKKNRALSEAAYIDYERTAAAYEVQYGLPRGMVSNNVTTLLEGEVSADEMLERVQMSSASSISAPQDFKDTMKSYYGIDSDAMAAAYYLDPTVAAPILQRRFNSGLIGSEARKQKVDLDVSGAEYLQGLGVTQSQAGEGFGVVAGAKGLTQGRGDVTTNRELISATLGQDSVAQENVARVVGAKKGQFQGGGSFLQDNRGGSGLGSAATR